MKLKSLLTFFLLVWVGIGAFAQTEVTLNTKPEWSIKADGRKPERLDLFTKTPDNKVAIAVNPEKSDFGIALINQNTEQLWLTLLEGEPIALKYFNNKIYVIAASKKDPSGATTKKYTSFILEPSTGQKLTEKVIYEFGKGYNEESEFHFKDDGSQFSLISKAIETKDNVKMVGDYSIITFDNQLNLLKVFTPTFKPNKSFISKIEKDGNLMISTFDKDKDIINFTLKDILSGKNLGDVNLQLKTKLNPEKTQLISLYDPNSQHHYIGIIYEEANKNKNLILGKINFTTGEIATNEEQINEDYFKKISKAYKAINKKADDYYFNPKFPALLDLKIIANNLVVELTSQYEVIYNGLAVGLIANNSVFIRFYSPDLKFSFQSIFPRSITTYREGTSLFYHFNNNILSVIGNTATGYNFTPLIQNIDLSTQKTLSLDKIPAKKISDKFYIVTQGVQSVDNNRVFIPYAQRSAALRSKKEVILQVLQL